VQEIPVESFQVPDIEDNPVSLRNRPLINRIRQDDGKNLIAAHSRIIEPLKQNGLDLQPALRCHVRPPEYDICSGLGLVSAAIGYTKNAKFLLDCHARRRVCSDFGGDGKAKEPSAGKVQIR
jgi:hypothetical protein